MQQNKQYYNDFKLTLNYYIILLLNRIMCIITTNIQEYILYRCIYELVYSYGQIISALFIVSIQYTNKYLKAE